MAKIDIYETEEDVKREALKDKVQRGNALTIFGMQSGFILGVAGLFSAVFDATGFLEREKLSWKQAFKEPTTVIQLAVGGAGLFTAAIASLLVRKAQKQLVCLGKEEPQQVIVPDNLSHEALSVIPIRPVDEQKLTKVPAADLKTHTQRLLDAVHTPSEKSL